jgi:hypothetical protein
MLAFLEQTWFLWWILAALAILRWFHNVAADGAEDVTAYEDDSDDGSRTARLGLQSLSS